jgi:hypothetical protein
MKQLLLTLLMASIYWHSNGQATPNSSGNSKTINNTVYDYSIGEMVLVNTATKGNLTLTQGLLQPHVIVENLSSENTSVLNLFNVYPNPTSSLLNIASQIGNAEILKINLLDITGKLIFTQTPNDGFNKQTIDISTLANGQYVLSIEAKNKQNNKTTKQQFKIIKQ